MAYESPNEEEPLRKEKKSGQYFIQAGKDFEQPEKNGKI